MAIVDFVMNDEPVPARAEKVNAPVKYPTEYNPENTITTYEWAVGRVLKEWERNGYDDSDFYVLYWDGEKAVEYQYATTRGWTYPCMATSVDATPEVRAAYEVWQKKQDRNRRANAIREMRKVFRKTAEKTGVPFLEVQKFGKQVGPKVFSEYLFLLMLNPRSGFWQSLKAQVITWLSVPASRKYKLPLSPKQYGALTLRIKQEEGRFNRYRSPMAQGIISEISRNWYDQHTHWND